MDHEAYLATIRAESERFLDALRAAPPSAPVPSCPGWTAADLAYHLAEVQHSWAQVVETGRSGEDVPDPPRPADDELVDLAARSGTELLTALHGRDASDATWSWHADGGSVAWVARRQAHEALIHRVDAELTAGWDVRPPTVELAADGVDELLRVMVDGVPAWGAFTPDGLTVRLECTNTPAAWTLALGRFTGTSPTSGNTYDLDAAAVLDEDEGGEDTLVVRGHAWDLDRWLWGRGDDSALEVTGDPAVLARLRELVTEATQ